MPLKLTRRARSPYWYVRGSIRGVSVCESTGLSDRRAAEDVLALRAAEITRRSVHGDPATRTFAEAALSFMEAGGEKKHLAPLIKLYGRRPLATLGQADVDDACRKLKPGAAPATLNRQIIAPFSAVLHHAARKKWCERPILARRKEPKGRVRWITHEEADRLILAAAPHLKPLVTFLLSTGCRLSEALYLDWREVDLERAQVTFLHKPGTATRVKNQQSRCVPLHPRAVAALSALPHTTGAVFRQHYGGERWDGRKVPVGPPYADRKGIGGGQVKTAWATMCARAGISDFTPHDCRHTWATWHYRENKDLLALMELGGWKSIRMVERYAHVDVSRLAPGQLRIWGQIGTLSGDSASPETGKPLRHKA